MSSTAEKTTCSQCNSNISTKKHVYCSNCNSSYHFSPCCSLTEIAYKNLTIENKAEWRCHRCKVRTRSETNNAYQTITFEEVSQQKKPREDDEESNSSTKKFKDSLTITSLNSGLISVQSELKDIKSSIELLNKTVIENNTQNSSIINELKNSITQMASSVASLATKVSDLYEKKAKQEIKINEIDTKVNQLDQIMLKNNIEIKNVSNSEISATEILTKIAESVNVEINNSDINNAYRINKAANKTIIEFTTLNKKRELMSKFKQHRIDAKIVNQTDDGNKFIYINDQLTAYNRRLLWSAKTKAKECGWKFVWIRNGTICARKNETSPLIMITNNADIELINSA